VWCAQKKKKSDRKIKKSKKKDLTGPTLLTLLEMPPGAQGWPRLVPVMERLLDRARLNPQ